MPNAQSLAALALFLAAVGSAPAATAPILTFLDSFGSFGA